MVYQKKRWQLAVTAGRNVPFIGGSKVTLGTRGLDKKIKSVVMQQAKKTEEIKLRVVGINNGDFLYHDTLHSVAPLQNLEQGLTSYKRIGKQIFLRNMRLSGQISNRTAQGQCSYRIMLIRSTNAYYVGDAWGSGIGSTDVLYNTGVPKIMELIDHKSEGSKVLLDKRITVSPTNGGGINTVPFQFDYKPMHKITYTGEDTSHQTTPYSYYWVVIPFVLGGSVGQTQVGLINSVSLLSFIDA